MSLPAKWTERKWINQMQKFLPMTHIKVNSYLFMLAKLLWLWETTYLESISLQVRQENFTYKLQKMGSYVSNNCTFANNNTIYGSVHFTICKFFESMSMITQVPIMNLGMHKVLSITIYKLLKFQSLKEDQALGWKESRRSWLSSTLPLSFTRQFMRCCP